MTTDVVLHKHDVLRELSEIRNQLSYAKRLGFLFGAGSSRAMGISDIGALTEKVRTALTGTLQSDFIKVQTDLPDGAKHIEAILNKVRLIRQVTGNVETKQYDGIGGLAAKDLDKAICDEIYKIITTEETTADKHIAKKFIHWLNWLPRDFTKEIFTLNYDLIFEKSFESILIPFYDGFVGSYEPFFAHESLDAKSNYDRPPISWIRLWKLHGSLGWFWKENEERNSFRVVRLSAGSREKYPDSELVIYPSRDKYESSRKQPFTSYFDRLKDFLLQGEGIFIISGYSFSDDHVNEVIFNGLNQNNRIHVMAFFYSDDPLNKLVAGDKNFPNLTMIGPTRALISGIYGEWDLQKGDELVDPFWSDNKLSIGNFKELVNFFVLATGLKNKSDEKVARNEK